MTEVVEEINNFRTMTYKKIDHVAIAVGDLDQAISFYQTLLGAKAGHIEEVENQNVKVVFFSVADTNLELLSPTSPDSPIAKYLENNPRGGLHHICFEVSDLEGHLNDLKNKGMSLISDTPQVGAHGKRVAFIHPKSTGGVLIELSEKVKDD